MHIEKFLIDNKRDTASIAVDPALLGSLIGKAGGVPSS